MIFLDRYQEPPQGVDPGLLAKQLHDIQVEGTRMSPGASPTSSQPEVYVTPTTSTPVSSPPTPPSPSAEMPPEPLKVSILVC